MFIILFVFWLISKEALFMKAKKYKHLSFEDRCVIEEFLSHSFNFTQISNRLGKDRTTISKEILNHRFLRGTASIKDLVVLNLNLLMFVIVVTNLIIVRNKSILILPILLITNINKL